MTALSRSALQTLWADHYFPTSSDFSDVMDSFTLYSAGLENLGASLASGQTGVPRWVSPSTVAFFTPSQIGMAILTAATTAAAVGVFGASSAGSVTFTVSKTAQANNSFGSGSCGAQLFSCATTAAVEAIVSQSVVASYPVPVGAISVYTLTAIPTGWLACNGQAVSRTTYQDLLNAISYVYGSGDGVTTFNVPDLRGRTVFGNDVMGNTSAARITTAGSGINGNTTGAVGGTETHTLTTAQIAAHAHGIGSIGIPSGLIGSAACGSYAQSSVGTQNAGSGSAHQNTPPAIVLNYMIRALT